AHAANPPPERVSSNDLQEPYFRTVGVVASQWVWVSALGREPNQRNDPSPSAGHGRVVPHFVKFLGRGAVYNRNPHLVSGLVSVDLQGSERPPDQKQRKYGSQGAQSDRGPNADSLE